MTVHTGKLDAGLNLTIPEAFAAELGLAPHSPVDISLHGAAVIVRQARQTRQTRSALDVLLEQVTEQNRHTAIDTGAAVGREVW